MRYKIGEFAAKLNVHTAYECGILHDMPLSKRRMIYECGNVKDRDLSAAINILKIAVLQQLPSA